MADMAAHDWFRPRLAALLKEAGAAGYAPDVFTAVVTDIVNTPEFVALKLAPEDPGWAQDVGEPEGASSEMPVHQSPITNEPPSLGSYDQAVTPLPGPGWV